MRYIDSHRVNGVNEQLTIAVLDEPGAGGAHHLYCIRGFNTKTNPSDAPSIPVDQCAILFQNGPIKEAGVNGITHETLLAILIDRLEYFQAGQYRCEENEAALQSLKEAQVKLLQRTARRVARGVEGTHTV